MKVEITLKKILAFTLCITFIVVSFAIVLNFQEEKSSIETPLIKLIPQQIATSDNGSSISGLNAQIVNLKLQINELETTIAQKENENKNLKQQVNNLQGSLNQIISELDSFEKIEQIRLTVERLRNEP